MELRHIITFLTIVEKGGFHKAAESLGYAQSSITAHMKELEGELGCVLFDRLGKMVVLSYHGRLFLPYARQMIRLSNESVSVLNKEKEPSGELTIGVSESLIIYRFPSLLKEYQKKHSRVEVKLKPILRPRKVLLSYQSKEIDLALINHTENWTLSGMTCEPLTMENMMLLRPVDNWNESHIALYTEADCSFKEVFDHFLENSDGEITSSLELWSVEAIKRCVMNGLGFSVLPAFTVSDGESRDHLNLTSLFDSSPGISTYLVYPESRSFSPTVESMIQFILDYSQCWNE